MGRYRNTGLFKFKKKDKEDFEIKYELDLSKDYDLEEGIKELEKAGVKFKRDEVKFVIRDKSGQLIWLENGNDDVGLKHFSEHKEDFENYFNIKIEDFADFIKNMILNSKVLCEHKTIKKGKEGLEKIYEYGDKHFILGGIGTNGFIISMYPIDEKEYKRKLKQYEEN